jgi:hypothetical protein
MSAYSRLPDKKDTSLQNQVKTIAIIKFDTVNIYCKNLLIRLCVKKVNAVT